MKINKKTFFVTAIITILPMFIGIAYWNQLPDIMATHWGMNNEVNGTMPKEFVVFGIPTVILLLHLICAFAHRLDPKNENHSPKMLNLSLWIAPIISLFAHFAIYFTALGYEINMSFIATFLMGIMFLVIGNYLPKCKQNYTIGIKLPWTLESEDNWNKTHRFSGYVLMISGLLVICLSVLSVYKAIAIVMVLSILIPIIYSYMNFKNSEKNS